MTNLIKTPVRYDEKGQCLRQDGITVLRIENFAFTDEGQQRIHEYGQQIATAINEHANLTAEVERLTAELSRVNAMVEAARRRDG